MLGVEEGTDEFFFGEGGTDEFFLGDGGADDEPACRGLEHAARHGFLPSGADACNLAVNEAFLLHGLRTDVVAEVCSSGLNERLSGANAGSLFGEGTYLAEDIEKIDQYTGLDLRG